MDNPDPEVRQLLADLRDFNKERRRRAVYKLGMRGGEDALRALMIVVENDNEDLIVRGRAAQMLGKMGDQRAVSPLIRALNASGYQTPMYAAEALGKLGDQRAIEPLRSVIDEHDNEGIRNAAVTAVTRLERKAKLSEHSPSDDLEPIGEP